MPNNPQECPFKIGQRVRVKAGDNLPGWTVDWPGTWRIVAIFWEYNKGAGHQINIGLANDDEIHGRYGATDGFRVDHLEAVD